MNVRPKLRRALCSLVAGGSLLTAIGLGFAYYWEHRNAVNGAIGHDIVLDLLECSAPSATCFEQLQRDWDLSDNDEIDLVLLDAKSFPPGDIRVLVHRLPLGPSAVFSLRSREWTYEE
jgi:hypothetical protein